MNLIHATAHEAHALLIGDPDITIIDVRTDEEFEMFFIQGAVNLDCEHEDFETHINGLDREKKYLVHCHSGDRSIETLIRFRALGFKHIIHLDGGLRDWAAQELPHIYNYTI